MPIENIKPPYVAYKTFTGFIEQLRGSGVPARIDRSVMPGQSGASQSNIISTLRFFSLIDAEARPTDDLRALITQPQNQASIFARLVRGSYDFLFTDEIDLETATEAQLTEEFRKHGLGGDTVRKCVSFFIQVAEAAGIAVSPHISQRKVAGGAAQPIRRPRRRRVGNNVGDAGDEEPPQPVRPQSLEEMLIAKFPDFSPEWNPEMQAKWFAAFEHFMKAAKSAKANDPILPSQQ